MLGKTHLRERATPYCHEKPSRDRISRLELSHAPRESTIKASTVTWKPLPRRVRAKGSHAAYIPTSPGFGKGLPTDLIRHGDINEFNNFRSRSKTIKSGRRQTKSYVTTRPDSSCSKGTGWFISLALSILKDSLRRNTSNQISLFSDNSPPAFIA
ncbi:hypothetical protein J6590_081543 [Homalodisca vitripennis]|nr:hypothetical protein J6590_081543 [Homalodisca vitripennis]